MIYRFINFNILEKVYQMHIKDVDAERQKAMLKRNQMENDEEGENLDNSDGRSRRMSQN